MKPPKAFVASMQSFDKDTVSDAQFSKLFRYATDPDMSCEKIKSKSAAAVDLYAWVIALYNYCETKNAIQGLPKQIRKVAATEERK